MTLPIGAVASGHPAATAAGVTLLRNGASALDAAIAADAVMGVIEPIATGIGGDVMAVIADDTTTVAYDGAGRTGRDMSLDAVTDAPNGYLPNLGGVAATVPGVVRGWWDLHQRHGRVRWSTLFDAAIDAAENGAALGSVAARTWTAQASRLDAAGRGLYLPDGNAPAAGAVWRNPQLAALLRAIAADGPEVFYDSPVADAIATAVTASGGRMCAADVREHRGAWVDVHFSPVGDMEICTVPPPCQGLVVGLAAGLLDERGCLDDLSPAGQLALAEALDRAFAVAADEVFDRDASTLPSVSALRDAARQQPLRGPVPYGPGTVFTAAADDTTMVALVSSVCDRFGSGVTVDGHGFVLGSRARGFCVDPRHPNVVGPGKRPYHSIVPTVVRRGGRPWLAMGVVGGIMQPQGQLQILRSLLSGADIAAAIAAPRLRILGDGVVAVEDGIDAARRDALATVYDLQPPTGVDFGGGQAVVRTTTGLAAGSDPRKDGVATVL